MVINYLSRYSKLVSVCNPFNQKMTLFLVLFLSQKLRIDLIYASGGSCSVKESMYCLEKIKPETLHPMKSKSGDETLILYIAAS